ncbi:MAG: UbiA family prenyltransferase [Bacteroidia bacterium]
MATSQANTPYLKLAALLTIVKWKTVALTALAQYLAFLFAFSNASELWHSLSEVKVHLIILATALFLAAGNIINNFYDAERDLINRPNKARFQHLVSKAFSLRFYMLLNAIGTLVAFYASWRIGIFFVVYGFALWFYSHKLSKLVLIREFAASLLAVTAFFSLLLYFRMAPLTFLVYGFAIFLVVFSREVYKDIRSMKGDVILGYKTIVTQLGVVPSIRIFQVLMITSLLPDLLLLTVMDKSAWLGLMPVIAVLTLIAVLILPIEVVKRKKWVQGLLQLIIALYIGGLVWL